MKRHAILATLIAILVLSAVCASAITLEESFSDGSDYNRISSSEYYDSATWKKTTWAKTVGYSGYHYVRAWIGGGVLNPSGAVADSYRKYGSGDVYASCSYVMDMWLSAIPQTQFPTGHSSYGSN